MAKVQRASLSGDAKRLVYYLTYRFQPVCSVKAPDPVNFVLHRISNP